MKNPLVVYPKGVKVPPQEPQTAPQLAKTSLSLHKGSGLPVAMVQTQNVSPLVTMGIFLPSGSRYEDQKTAGASHLLKHLAFKVCDIRCISFGDDLVNAHPHRHRITSLARVWSWCANWNNLALLLL